MHAATSTLHTLLLNAGVLAGALFLHVAVAFVIVTSVFNLNPIAPKPELITDSIEMLIAETEAELPTEASPPTLPASAPIPTPHEAAYLVAPDASFALPPPDLDVDLPPLPQPTQWTPELPLSSSTEPNAELPEITLPPAERLPEDTPPREAAGATARQDHPKLTTDIQTYLRKHYPKEARRNGWEGKVTLKILISADGKVSSVDIHTSSGYPTLDRAALRMMRSARYTHGPATLTQTIEYKLK